jgi:hypothetical protein
MFTFLATIKRPHENPMSHSTSTAQGGVDKTPGHFMQQEDRSSLNGDINQTKTITMKTVGTNPG